MYTFQELDIVILYASSVHFPHLEKNMGVAAMICLIMKASCLGWAENWSNALKPPPDKKKKQLKQIKNSADGQKHLKGS